MFEDIFLSNQKKILNFKLFFLFLNFTLIAQQKEFNYTYNSVENSNFLVVIFPGLGFNNIETDEKLTLNEFLTNHKVSSLIIDVSHNLFLEQTIFEATQSIISKYSEGKKVIIGGFSIGGNLALNFYNFIQPKNPNKINIKGVFLIDSPIDLKFLYQISKSKLNNELYKTQENEMICSVLENYQKEIGVDFFENFSPILLGKPEEYKNKYKDLNFLIFSKPNFSYKKSKGYNADETNYFVLKNFFQTMKNIEKENVFFDDYPEDMKNPHEIEIVNNEIFLKWIERFK